MWLVSVSRFGPNQNYNMKPTDQVLSALSAMFPGEMVLGAAIHLDTECLWLEVETIDRDHMNNPITAGEQLHRVKIQRPATRDELRYFAGLLLQAAGEA